MSQQSQNSTLALGLNNMLRDFTDVCNTVPRDIYINKPENTSSIGAHMRHSLEFVQMLTEQAESGTVDYELRTRNTLFESDPEVARLGFSNTITKLTALINKMGGTQVITVLETPGFGIEKTPVTSSLGREVLFAIQHCIHHFAIIKMMAQSQGIQFSPEFGVTSATQTHNLKVAAKG